MNDFYFTDDWETSAKLKKKKEDKTIYKIDSSYGGVLKMISEEF